MKKIKYLILLIALILFPSIVNAEGNISITKIIKKDITGYAYEVNPPTFDGLQVNYNLSFNTVGDSVTYIATVKNSDKEEYKIENKNSFSPSGYMTYEFKFSDNTNTIKPNETKDMYITIKYTKPVPAEKLVNGEYKEQNQMNLLLVNNEGQIPNPNTNSTILFVLFIVSLLIISIVLFKKHKKVSVLLLVLSLLIPITTYALKEIKITLNTQVSVEKDLKLCVYDPRSYRSTLKVDTEPDKMFFSYTNGMKLIDWYNNNPDLVNYYFGNDFNINNYTYEFYKNGFIECINDVYMRHESMLKAAEIPHEMESTKIKGVKGVIADKDPDSEFSEFLNEINKCHQDYAEEVNLNNLIKNRNEGCYRIIYNETVTNPTDPTDPTDPPADH